MATYSDDFNRANGALSGDWATEVGAGLAINGNQVRRGTGASPAISSLSALNFDNDHSSEIEIATYVNFDAMGVGVRFDGSGNGYIAYPEGGRIYIQRFDSGTPTLIHTIYSITISDGDTLRLEATGTTLEVFQNDSSIGSTTDATHTSGSPALYYNAGNSNLSYGDNFSAEGHQAVAPTPTLDNIDTDNDVQVGQTGAVIAASGISSSSSTQTVTLGGEPLTVTGWSE